jgi:hypothetical protein
MNGATDWKTTAAGFAASVCTLVELFLPGAKPVCDVALAVALAGLGYFAKDRH